MIKVLATPEPLPMLAPTPLKLNALAYKYAEICSYIEPGGGVELPEVPEAVTVTFQSMRNESSVPSEALDRATFIL